jgi:hypothetical protein
LGGGLADVRQVVVEPRCTIFDLGFFTQIKHAQPSLPLISNRTAAAPVLVRVSLLICAPPNNRESATTRVKENPRTQSTSCRNLVLQGLLLHW